MAETNGIYPFIGFHFKEQSSKDNYNIYRVSEGDRYTIDLDSDSQDITVEVPGRDGVYYFGTTHKPKVFNIKIAFDSLTKGQLKGLKTCPTSASPFTTDRKEFGGTELVRKEIRVGS